MVADSQMQHLDLAVIEQAQTWARTGETVWLCTVLSSYGSSPREPGSWLVANAEGVHVGSLSGGCVEEDFLARLRDGVFADRISSIRYGAPEGPADPPLRLPCGGVLDVLIEKLPPDHSTRAMLEQLHAALTGGEPLVRRVSSLDGHWTIASDAGLGPRVEQHPDQQAISLRVGPVARLIIAGISPVSVACAEFAQSLGFEVIVCDPREEEIAGFAVPGVELVPVLPSLYITQQRCHPATAVVALTHDPRIDDLALIEAVRTEAFYIGVMGSKRTSQTRAERLGRSGGLSTSEIDRIHMPIGLALGSKTPAEIALAVMADIVRVRRGRTRDAL